ncbi:MAG TPA: sigma-70 family RNA polymerase sigma factor [Polyangiaceae bacterium]|nr:sigma-70 family RNA polymerase sigma factor [Polyangiaceae bacterium]
MSGHDAGESPLQSANDRAIRRLVEEHFDFIWRLVRRLGLSVSDADDATQEVFIVAARRITSIESGRERTFLYGTALRVLANARRGARRRREQPGTELAELAASARGPDELLDDERARTRLDALLAELPLELRRVVVLAELEELSVPEIATLEGLPLGTAASRLRRARERLRELAAEATEKGREASDA